MGQVQTAVYGSWLSPISADFIVAGSVNLSGPVPDGTDIYWLEGRPAEAGRSVIVYCNAEGVIRDITPAPYNVRSSAHEYGGGAYTVRNGVIYFVNFTDQGIYRQRPNEAPEPVLITPGLRFADLLIDEKYDRLICVCEDHRAKGEHEPRNSLVAIDLSNTGSPASMKVLASGADFYASPTLSPGTRQLAWLCWNHPQMPWDGTELWLSTITTDGDLTPARLVAGSSDESIFQPQWGPDGRLYFVSDRNGWWNLYRASDGRIESLLPMEAEFGMPQWIFGMSTYGFTDAGYIIGSYRRAGLWYLLQLDPDRMHHQSLKVPYTDIGDVRCQGSRVVFHGGSTAAADAIVLLDTAQDSPARVLRHASKVSVDERYISTPEPIEFPTSGGRTAYGFFYAPVNADFQAPTGEKPPLLVKSHGGPTASTSAAFNLGIQYWTSRGFAVVDVNYGGSTGYGRAYHQQLDGQWGVVDVDDCVAAARYLIDAGRVDGERCAIRGNSAGGYTTLAALTFRDLFRAGASYYGISDLEILARDTHKFESRYLDRLIGPYPQAQRVYRERSPIHFIDGLNTPMIFFQGLDDKVVPPNQAELMVEALRAKGIPVAYVPFAGERHGFRQAANIKRALEAELYFYARIFNFPLSENIEPVAIDNLTT